MHIQQFQNEFVDSFKTEWDTRHSPPMEGLQNRAEVHPSWTLAFKGPPDNGVGYWVCHTPALINTDRLASANTSRRSYTGIEMPGLELFRLLLPS